MTPHNTKQPNVPTLASPVGIDAAIQDIQLQLATLPWLEKSFGRAMNFPVQLEGQKRSEPRVYQGGAEYYACLPNDALKSYSFFQVVGARNTEEYAALVNYGNFPMRDNVALIVWGNLQEIDRTKDYVFTEELIKDVLNVLNSDGNTTVNRIVDERVEDIYKGYSLQPNHRDLLMFPFFAFRIEFLLQYQFSCL